MTQLEYHEYDRPTLLCLSMLNNMNNEDFQGNDNFMMFCILWVRIVTSCTLFSWIYQERDLPWNKVNKKSNQIN